eukprot:703944-Rhodomonas_salina.1
MLEDRDTAISSQRARLAALTVKPDAPKPDEETESEPQSDEVTKLKEKLKSVLEDNRLLNEELDRNAVELGKLEHRLARGEFNAGLTKVLAPPSLLLFAPSSLLLAPCSVFLAPYSLPLTFCPLPLCVCSLLLAPSSSVFFSPPSVSSSPLPLHALRSFLLPAHHTHHSNRRVRPLLPPRRSSGRRCWRRARTASGCARS